MEFDGCRRWRRSTRRDWPTSVGVGSDDDHGATSGAVAGTTTLTVTAAALVSIAVTPASPSIAAGNDAAVHGDGDVQDGSTQNLTSTATWSSSATTVATISAGGLATACDRDSTTIRATSGAVAGTTTLTVTAAALVSIAVTPANPSIARGDAAVHGDGNVQRREHAEPDEHGDVEFLGAECGDDRQSGYWHAGIGHGGRFGCDND